MSLIPAAPSPISNRQGNPTLQAPTQFQLAISTQDIPSLQEILTLNPSIAKYTHIPSNSPHDLTGLHLACSLPPSLTQAQIITLLLSHGADINATYGDAFTTPLILATLGGNAVIVKLLLDNGADEFKEWGECGNEGTAFEIAMRGNYGEIVELFLDGNGGEGYHVNYRGEKCERRDLDVEGKGKGEGEKVGQMLVHQAAALGRPGILKMVLEKGDGMRDLEVRDGGGKTALLAALWGERGWVLGEEREVQEGERRETVEILVGLGADINARDDMGRSVFLGAAHCGCIDLVARLLQEGWDIMDDGLSHLQTPSQEVSFQSTALHLAASAGYVNVVELLLLHSADPNTRDVDENFPLHLSISSNQHVSQYSNQEAERIITTSLKICQLLLNHRAYINAKTRQGMTALHLACAMPETLPLVQLLLDRGADINTQSSNSVSSTPLHASLLENHHLVGSTTCLELLLSQGADVNIRSLRGSSALHRAYQEGNMEAVNVLPRNGADVNARCIFGRTPVMYAAWAGRMECIEMLKNAGADERIVDFEGKGVGYWLADWKEREKKRSLRISGRGRGRGRGRGGEF